MTNGEQDKEEIRLNYRGVFVILLNKIELKGILIYVKLPRSVSVLIFLYKLK